MNSIFDMTRSHLRNRNESTVAEFHADMAKNGIAHAISWDASPVIVAEMVLANLDRFEAALEENSVERVLQMAADLREGHERQLSYFDPTNQSTSASATLVTAAEFKGRQAVISMFDELAGAYEMDNERR